MSSFKPINPVCWIWWSCVSRFTGAILIKFHRNWSMYPNVLKVRFRAKFVVVQLVPDVVIYPCSASGVVEFRKKFLNR